MRILVCGSRSFNDELIFLPWMRDIVNMSVDTVEIISGGAQGADAMAEKFADENGYPKTVVRPDWETDGKSAGIKRNLEMLDMNPDIVVAFWDGKSRGTQHTLIEAMKRKTPTLMVYF